MLFKADMVNAILDGRKTQTRRVIKQQPSANAVIRKSKGDSSIFTIEEKVGFGLKMSFIECPYGKAGAQLWVKEDCYIMDCKGRGNCHTEVVFNKSDCDELSTPLAFWNKTLADHMPRWCSRIQLEITDIRVERLNDISEQDAKAEGVEPYRGIDYDSGGNKYEEIDYKEGFENLWESINGEGSWEENPWVWVVEFKVLKINN